MANKSTKEQKPASTTIVRVEIPSDLHQMMSSTRRLKGLSVREFMCRAIDAAIPALIRKEGVR